MNCTLGGWNHVLASKVFCGVKENTTFVGADVTHLTKDTDATVPSMAGVIATADAYPKSARLQSNNVEVCNIIFE